MDEDAVAAWAAADTARAAIDTAAPGYDRGEWLTALDTAIKLWYEIPIVDRQLLSEIMRGDDHATE